MKENIRERERRGENRKGFRIGEGDPRGVQRNTRRDSGETDVVQKIDLDFPVAMDGLRYLALTMSSLFVAR